jgi:hypothetical protein
MNVRKTGKKKNKKSGQSDPITFYKLAIFSAGIFIFSYISLTTILSLAQIPSSIKMGTFTPPPTKKPVKPKNSPTRTKTNPTNPPESKFFHFSQLDPLWRFYASENKLSNVGDCGCGDTSVAMILAKNLNTSDNPSEGDYSPKKMWDEFARFGRVLGTDNCGTNMEWHVEVLKKFGFRGDVMSFDNDNKTGSLNVLNKYLKNGWSVILYIPGHYVLLEHIKGSDVYINDPLDPPDISEPKLLDGQTFIRGYVIAKL